MSIFQALVNLLAYACFTLGALFIWPSRKNLVAWLAVPFFIVAYLIPLSVVDYGNRGSSGAIELLTQVNAVGAVATLIGMLLGATSIMQRRSRKCRSGGEAPMQFSRKRVQSLMIIGCTLMSASFAWMQMLPIFADEPLLAKFFRGEYKVRYDQVATFYRLGQVLVATTLPAALVLLLDKRSKALTLAAGWALILFIVSLNRGTVAAGAVLLIGAWCSRSRWKMATFVLASTLVYCVGSGIYALLGLVSVNDSSILLEVARGAPDIADHIMFIDAFKLERDLTYGLTFIGGLIPGNFYFNPSVYTLAIVNDTLDVSDIASGGLRLPPSLAGYAALSWFGVIAVCAAFGFFTGRYTRLLQYLPRRTIHQQIVGILWYQIYAQFIIAFYSMSYMSLISVFLLAFISFAPTRVNRYVVPRFAKSTTARRLLQDRGLAAG